MILLRFSYIFFSLSKFPWEIFARKLNFFDTDQFPYGCLQKRKQKRFFKLVFQKNSNQKVVRN